MSVVQKEQKAGIVVTKTIENGQPNGPYTEDWGRFRIQGQMKDGKMNGVFYRFNTDMYHRDTPQLESMTIYENGNRQAEYELDSSGKKHGLFEKVSPAGERIKGRYEHDSLVEETVYNRDTNMPSVKRQYNKDSKITTFYTKNGLPTRRTTTKKDGSKTLECFDDKGNVSAIMDYDCNGILTKTIKVPPPPEAKKEERIEHESRNRDAQESQKKKTGLSGYLFDIVEECRRELRKREEQSQKQQIQRREYERYYQGH